MSKNEIPNGAKFEWNNEKISVYDVSHLLDEVTEKFRKKSIKDGKKRRKPYGKRNGEITTAIVHKTGANGVAGYQGCVNTTAFVVYHRGWDGPAYTFWFSRYPDHDSDGRIVVYRMQPDDVRSWHTGRIMNDVGIGLGVQGNYDGQWDLLSTGLPKIEREPTEHQWEALEAFIPYLKIRYGIVPGERDLDGDHVFTGHWEHGKPVCPGDALRLWVQEKRGDFKQPTIPSVALTEINTYKFSPKEFQTALRLVGFDPGPVNGIIGEETRAALEAFQEASFILCDGWYGEKTARCLKASLTNRGIDLPTLKHYLHIFEREIG